MIEVFAPQLTRDGAPLCTMCGQTMNGLNCTTASMAAWLFRATQGRIKTDACHVRELTNDCVGGTNLGQMVTIADHYGIKGYKLYQPIDFDTVSNLVRTGRYGAIIDVLYRPIAGTMWDRFHDTFFGNHAEYLSGPGGRGTLRTGDPGAKGYADVPISLLKTAAGDLDVGGGRGLGSGKVYALVTPIDPAVSTTTYKALITGPVQLYASPGGATAESISQYTYTVTRSKVGGFWWYRIVGPSKSSYVGRCFQPTRYTTISLG